MPELSITATPMGDPPPGRRELLARAPRDDGSNELGAQCRRRLLWKAKPLRTSAASTFPYFAVGTFALQDRLALGLRALTSGAVGGRVVICARNRHAAPVSRINLNPNAGLSQDSESLHLGQEV
jgi:hypothetical protein